MPHDIERILNAAAAFSWLIEEQKGREIAAFLALRAQGHGPGWAGEEHKPVYAMDQVTGRTGAVHVLNLHGTIMPRAGMMSRMSGAATLDQFQKAFSAAAADATAQAIVIDVDSPGGIVDFVQETADMIYAARRPNRPIIAVANTTMASAAYWIGAAADEIVATPSGLVGSIGVYSMHDDISGALERQGVKRTLIKSGPRKAEGMAGPLDAAALKHRQELAAATYEDFTTAIAQYRNVPVSVVRTDPESGAAAHFGGGRAYHPKEALRLGLIDRIATFEDTLMQLAGGQRSRRTGTARARLGLI